MSECQNWLIKKNVNLVNVRLLRINIIAVHYLFDTLILHNPGICINHPSIYINPPSIYFTQSRYLY